MGKRLIDFTDEELELLIENAVKKGLAQKEKPRPLNRHMNIDQCSEHTGIPKNTIYQKVSRREIPNGKVGGRLVFDRQEIDAWIASGKRTLVENL